MRYLGISRDEKFSPNRTEGDATVFHAVAAELEHTFNDVIILTERELVQQGIPDGIDGIFQMARSPDALGVLEKAAVPVTNSVSGVRNCVRARQTGLLKDSGLIPESLVCSTCGVPDVWKSYPCWIKRIDGHSVIKDDIQFLHNLVECSAAMLSFAERGMDSCVLQAHVRGWLVKFYGIRGEGLMDCYAASMKDSKFGLERYNDIQDKSFVDMEKLTVMAERVSRILDVEVYGGDAVVSPDGDIILIDFNDWPSFRTCTIRAARKIAELITGKGK